MNNNYVIQKQGETMSFQATVCMQHENMITVDDPQTGRLLTMEFHRSVPAFERVKIGDLIQDMHDGALPGNGLQQVLNIMNYFPLQMRDF